MCQTNTNHDQCTNHDKSDQHITIYQTSAMTATQLSASIQEWLGLFVAFFSTNFSAARASHKGPVNSCWEMDIHTHVSFPHLNAVCHKTQRVWRRLLPMLPFSVSHNLRGGGWGGISIHSCHFFQFHVTWGCGMVRYWSFLLASYSPEGWGGGGCHWWELLQLSFLSQQKFCRNKHVFVMTKYFCCEITFVVANTCLTKDLFCRDKHIFHNKHIFVATNTCLSWQNLFWFTWSEGCRWWGGVNHPWHFFQFHVTWGHGMALYWRSLTTPYGLEEWRWDGGGSTGTAIPDPSVSFVWSEGLACGAATHTFPITSFTWPEDWGVKCDLITRILICPWY